ncbi:MULTISPECIES: ParA family protein [unclassified Bradyrhizobium]|uniref:ParA family protein n=1 Tax=unclassified Bradyrhizobium TaxID=2631580 RepID=UPI0028F0ACB6|nr:MULTISPECIES: AAA family ATPase [unclassified Bradyrhizobium]
MSKAPKKMKTLALFNHKGGVGKTTLSVNIADSLADLGFCVLVVDADPQCNLSAFYMREKELDELLGESDDAEGGTIWSAIKPVIDGKGPIKDVNLVEVRDNVFLCPGDVLLADYEEGLPAAWTGSFARRSRDYDVMCVLSRAVRMLGQKCNADIIIYDVGPNVGPLNRTILLDADYFATPVAADLFSLRALSTVGRSLARWIDDWKTIRSLASPADRRGLLHGKPEYLGYITSAYKVASGRAATIPHEYWEAKIAPRVRDRIVADLRRVDPALVPHTGNKVGVIKNFQSLAPQAQNLGLAIGKLRGHTNSGYIPQIEEAASEFDDLAREIVKRMGLKIP